MMKQVTIKVRYILLLIFLLSSCSQQSTAGSQELEQQFAEVVPISDMNKSLQIILSTEETSFKAGSKIDIKIYNKSHHYLYFDNDTDVKLLGSLDQTHWMELEDGITDASSDMILSPQGTILLDDQESRVIPIIDPTELNTHSDGVLVRIVVIGEIMENDVLTGKKVGAYVDVIVQP